MEEFKIGDKVRCLPGFRSSDSGDDRGGHGYKEGYEFIISSMNNPIEDGSRVLWPRDGGCGVWSNTVQLVNQEPQYEIY